MNEKNEEYLQKVLNEISDEKIEKAVMYSKRKKAVRQKLVFVFAASFAVVVLAAFMFFKLDGSNKKPPIDVLPSSDSHAAVYTSEPLRTEYSDGDWQKLPFGEKYNDIEFNGKNGYAPTQKTVSNSKLSYYCDGKAVGENGNVTKKEDVKIYSVAPFSIDVVIAVNPKGKDFSYIFVNDTYSPKTLGDFIKATDFENEMLCRNISTSPEREGEKYFEYSFNEESKKTKEISALVFELLKKNEKSKLTYTPEYSDEKYVLLQYFSKTFDACTFRIYIFENGGIRIESMFGANFICFKAKKAGVKKLFSLFTGNEGKAEYTIETTVLPADSENENALSSQTTVSPTETMTATNPVGYGERIPAD